MARRNFSSTAQRTTLSAGCTDVATTMTVTAVTGWPASTPYALIIDPDTVNEEIVLVTNRASLTLTVTRAQGGTTGVAHSSGAVVQHGVYSQDFEDPNAFLNNAAAAPGPIQFSAGAVGAPAITTSGDSNTGIYFSAADTVAVTTGGTQRATFSSAGLTATTAVFSGAVSGAAATFSGVVTAPLGSVGAPAFTFSGDTNTGVYSPSADNISLATGGAQRLNIDSAGLFTGTGTSLGAWTSYTPAAASSTWALGNGTSGGRYVKVGRTVHCRGFVQFGTTSTFPTTTWGVNLPVAASTGLTFPTISFLSTGLSPLNGDVFGWDNSPGVLHRMTGFQTGDGVAAWFGVDTSSFGQFGTAGGATPFSWATSDAFAWSFTYESAA